MFFGIICGVYLLLLYFILRTLYIGRKRIELLTAALASSYSVEEFAELPTLPAMAFKYPFTWNFDKLCKKKRNK